MNILIFGGLPTGGGTDGEGVCEIVLIDLNPAYVAAGFGTRQVSCEKSWTGSKMV